MIKINKRKKKLGRHVSVSIQSKDLLRQTELHIALNEAESMDFARIRVSNSLTTSGAFGNREAKLIHFY